MEPFVFLITLLTLCHLGHGQCDVKPIGTPAQSLRHDGHENSTACPCTVKPCIRKCCPLGQMLDIDGCNISVVDFTPMFYNDLQEMTNDSLDQFDVLIGKPCSPMFRLEPHVYDDDEYFLYRNGSLHSEGNNNLMINADSYCLDIFEIGENTTYILPLVCFPPVVQKGYVVYFIYPIFLIISSIFLLVTLFVYAVIPDLRNLHGKCLMSHVLSLFVAYISLSIIQLKSNKISEEGCISMAFIVEFSFLASFFWLNAMCFDIWWTFSSLQIMKRIKATGNRKFIFYSLYAWGCPAIFLIVSMVMDLTPNISSLYLKPGFGEMRCWFNDKAALFAYFYGPISVIILCNLILFLTTAFKIRNLRKGHGSLKNKNSTTHDNSNHKNRMRFNLYLKLFIVMGVNWATEVISWAIGGPAVIWYVTDVGNMLQGVFVFVIFVCKRRILRLLKERFGRTDDIARRDPTSSRYAYSRSTTLSTASTAVATNSMAMDPLMSEKPRMDPEGEESDGDEKSSIT